jgi:hypothetical protein
MLSILKKAVNILNPFGKPTSRIERHGMDELVHIERRRLKSGSVARESRVRVGPNHIHAWVGRTDGTYEDLGVHPNLMTYIGGTIMAGWWGFQAAGSTLASFISSTSPTSTTIQDTGSLMTASALSTPQIGLTGMRVWATPHTSTNPLVWTNIISNTTHVITGDAWWKFGAAAGGVPITGTTPTSGDSYVVAPAGLAGLQFIALTNDSGAAAAGDLTLASEITSNGLGRVMATFAHTQSKAAFNAVTLTNTFTASGSQSCQKAGLFSALSSAGADPMFFEANFSAASLVSGDTLSFSWTITLSG